LTARAPNTPARLAGPVVAAVLRLAGFRPKVEIVPETRSTTRTRWSGDIGNK